MSVGRALVYGGRGALGSTVVKAFKVGLMSLKISFVTKYYNN